MNVPRFSLRTLLVVITIFAALVAILAGNERWRQHANLETERWAANANHENALDAYRKNRLLIESYRGRITPVDYQAKLKEIEKHYWQMRTELERRLQQVVTPQEFDSTRKTFDEKFEKLSREVESQDRKQLD